MGMDVGRKEMITIHDDTHPRDGESTNRWILLSSYITQHFGNLGCHGMGSGYPRAIYTLFIGIGSFVSVCFALCAKGLSHRGIIFSFVTGRERGGWGCNFFSLVNGLCS